MTKAAKGLATATSAVGHVGLVYSCYYPEVWPPGPDVRRWFSHRIVKITAKKIFVAGHPVQFAVPDDTEDGTYALDRAAMEKTGECWSHVGRKKFYSEERFIEIQEAEEKLNSQMPVQSDDACFVVLGVTATATPDSIITAYRKLALVHHPDTGGGAEAFRVITEAKDRALSLIAGTA